MGLVTAKEVAKAINVDKYGVLGTFSGWMLMKLLKISTLNKVYNRNKDLEDVAFLNGVLDDLQIKFEIPEEDLKRLPKEGAYITISNHPLGGIDGVLLLKLMLEREPNFKIIANFLLHRIEPLKKYIMPVNPGCALYFTETVLTELSDRTDEANDNVVSILLKLSVWIVFIRTPLTRISRECSLVIFKFCVPGYAKSFIVEF